MIGRPMDVGTSPSPIRRPDETLTQLNINYDTQLHEDQGGPLFIEDTIIQCIPSQRNPQDVQGSPV